MKLTSGVIDKKFFFFMAVPRAMISSKLKQQRLWVGKKIECEGAERV